jgi:hypothetical protein
MEGTRSVQDSLLNFSRLSQWSLELVTSRLEELDGRTRGAHADMRQKVSLQP